METSASVESGLYFEKSVKLELFQRRICDTRCVVQTRSRLCVILSRMAPGSGANLPRGSSAVNIRNSRSAAMRGYSKRTHACLRNYEPKGKVCR